MGERPQARGAGRAGAGRVGAGERPLAGRTVVVTRPAGQAEALARPLEQLGADVLRVPVIRIVPVVLGDEIREAIARLPEYGLLVFTSVNGVAVFLGFLDETGPGAAALAAARIAAIGPATAAALEERGVACDVVPDDYVAEGLLAALERHGVAPAGARVLIPRAREARSVLPDTLRANGALVDVLPVYETLPAERLPVPPERIEAADYVTFTSSSTAREFAALMERAGGAGAGRPLDERLAGARLCSIGPVTSATLRELGLTVVVEAAEYTTGGLVAAIAADARAGAGA